MNTNNLDIAMADRPKGFVLTPSRLGKPLNAEETSSAKPVFTGCCACSLSWIRIRTDSHDRIQIRMVSQ